MSAKPSKTLRNLGLFETYIIDRIYLLEQSYDLIDYKSNLIMMEWVLNKNFGVDNSIIDDTLYDSYDKVNEVIKTLIQYLILNEDN